MRLTSFLLTVALTAPCITLLASQEDREFAEGWRASHRTIDLHQHITCTSQHLARAARIMDAVGIGIGVNLSGGTTIAGKEGVPSEFARNKQLAEALFPGRFLHYMNLDYSGWDNPDFAQQAVKQVEEGSRLGAAGLKEFKRLGLGLKDGSGKLLKIDDSKLDGVWKRCGELNMPVSIHVGDPKAFWLPYNETNERWNELKDHPSWWFGDTNKFPPWKEILDALNRVIERHPKTTFVCVHFANNAEEPDWVDDALTRHPNMMADLAARIPEIGRHNPDKLRRLFIKHQDRIFFATDFQSAKRLILGSSGNEPPPTEAEAELFFIKEWRWLETNDKNWPHMTPIQGDWTISSIGLPAPVLRKIYFDNARKLLGRSFPLPTVRARHIGQDFQPGGNSDIWQTAEPVYMEYESRNYASKPDLSTRVRLLWSNNYLYLGYECPYTKLTVFQPPQERERYSGEKNASLWDRDVVEAFIASDPENLKRYTEFEVAPTNEKLDLKLALPDRDFEWSSKFETAINVDAKQKIWRCEMRIPMSALSGSIPKRGDHWRINLYRCDRAHNAFLAWSPTVTGGFHIPEKFGALEFVE